MIIGPIHATPLTSARRVDVYPALTVQPPAWTIDALCAKIDTDMFFPDKGGSTREGKQVCGACPVRAECLAYALANHERFGIWGGYTERDRRLMQSGQPIGPFTCPDCARTFASARGIRKHDWCTHGIRRPVGGEVA
jgi:hypothetical protein